MRIAALYDIHGNLPALEAVLAEIDTLAVDLIVVGGDVLPGPMPTECLALLRALATPVSCIRGNGDREALTARATGVSATVPERFRPSMAWVAAQLSAEDVDWIASWPATLRLEARDTRAERDLLFCHATPANDTDLFTRLTPDAELVAWLEPSAADVVVCGHTHMQFDRTVPHAGGTTRVVNAGSVGMPFAAPGAYWLLFDPAAQLRFTPYDLDSAAARVRATAYPQAEEFAAGSILDPPTEAAMLAALGPKAS